MRNARARTEPGDEEAARTQGRATGGGHARGSTATAGHTGKNQPNSNQSGASRHESGLDLHDGIANADDAADQDVGVDAGPMGELLDDPRSRPLLEMAAGLAELDAEAFDLADAEALADEAVDVHVAHRHLPPGPTRTQSDLLDDLG